MFEEAKSSMDFGIALDKLARTLNRLGKKKKKGKKR